MRTLRITQNSDAVGQKNRTICWNWLKCCIDLRRPAESGDSGVRCSLYEPNLNMHLINWSIVNIKNIDYSSFKSESIWLRLMPGSDYIISTTKSVKSLVRLQPVTKVSLSQDQPIPDFVTMQLSIFGFSEMFWSVLKKVLTLNSQAYLVCLFFLPTALFNTEQISDYYRPQMDIKTHESYYEWVLELDLKFTSENSQMLFFSKAVDSN